MRNGRGRKEGRRGREEGGVYRKGRESKAEILNDEGSCGLCGCIYIYHIIKKLTD